MVLSCCAFVNKTPAVAWLRSFMWCDKFCLNSAPETSPWRIWTNNMHLHMESCVKYPWRRFDLQKLYIEHHWRHITRKRETSLPTPPTLSTILIYKNRNFISYVLPFVQVLRPQWEKYIPTFLVECFENDSCMQHIHQLIRNDAWSEIHAFPIAQKLN